MDLNIHSALPRRKDFRIGILGSGFIVNDCHLVAYRKAGFNPVAIASRSRRHAESVAKRHTLPTFYDKYEQLLDDPTIEVLDIAVPPNAQLGLIKAACARKTVKGILAQKPLGMNYAEALEAVTACETAGITLGVNQNMRYDHSVRAAKTLLENGTIGEPIFATIEMRGIPHWMDWHKDLGWLTLRIMSIHHLDTFRYWFGDPEGIYCSVRPDPRTKFPHTDGICTYVLEYENNLRCVGIDDTWTGPAKEGSPKDNYLRWRIEGLNGLAIGDIGWCKDPYTTPSTIRYAAKGDEEFHAPSWPESWFPDAFIGTMAQLLIALESGTEPAISGRDNLKTMALVEAAYQSVQLRGSVDVGEHFLQPGGAAEQPGKRRQGFLKRFFSAPKPMEVGPSTDLPPGFEQPLSNFTPRSMRILSLARKEAERFNHNFVGTEHVLLGLIGLGQGVAVTVLRRLGVDLEAVREEMKKVLGTVPSENILGNFPYTPRVKKVLALAAKEAKALNHTYVGTEHILLGLLREGDGVAARMFLNLGVDVDHTRREILRELDPSLTEARKVPTVVRVELPSSAKDEPIEYAPLAQRAFSLARQEAERLHHSFIGTEHLMLGLIKLEQGVAFVVLHKLGVVLETVRLEIEMQVPIGPEEQSPHEILYTPTAKKVLELGKKEAKALGHRYFGTEHILLGILREGDGVAARILQKLDVTFEQTRQEIQKELGLG